MKKLLACAFLGVVGWMAASVGWAVAARTTGIPGPARAAHASVDAAAGALEAIDLPRPLAYPRRALARQMRAGGRAIVGLYFLPERIASGLVGGPGGAWLAGIDAELCAAPVPALEAAAGRALEAEIEREVRGRLETVGHREEWMRERIRERLERTRERAEARGHQARRAPPAPRGPEARAIVVRIQS